MVGGGRTLNIFVPLGCQNVHISKEQVGIKENKSDNSFKPFSAFPFNLKMSGFGDIILRDHLHPSVHVQGQYQIYQMFVD